LGTLEGVRARCADVVDFARIATFVTWLAVTKKQERRTESSKLRLLST
jgi:hypothetical protein